MSASIRIAGWLPAYVIVVIAACGGGGGTLDGGTLDGAADGGSDGAVEDADTPSDAAVDVGPSGCACDAFEQCEDSVCACAPGEALCGTRGHAGFPLVSPAERQLRVVDDVVLDDVTGLTWQRMQSATTERWPAARALCEELVLGGRDDWRLPARIELATILDAARTPSLDTDVFESESQYFWTSSRPAGGVPAAYAIYFGQGETVVASTEVAGGSVRCVAGARDVVPRPTVVEGRVRNDVTELTWDRDVGDASSFAEATSRCESEGARLPTLYELHDLVDEARRAPAIDPALFPATPSEPFWTSTLRDFGEILVWVVDFTDGQTTLASQSSEARVRCVR